MDINLLKKLRTETKAGFLECKEALIKFNNDYEKAYDYIINNIKKTEGNIRVASKGLTALATNKNDAFIFEVNAETDFASKNSDFLNLIKTLKDTFIHSGIKNINDAKKLMINNKSVSETISITSGIMQENLTLRRFYRIKKEDYNDFGIHIHQNGKISSLVILEHYDIFSNEIAKVITAYNPKYISTAIDEDTLNYEKYLFAQNSEGFDNFNDYLQSKALHNLKLLNEDITVGEYIKKSNNKILDFYRFEVGQGIDGKLNCKLDFNDDKVSVTPC